MHRSSIRGVPRATAACDTLHTMSNHQTLRAAWGGLALLAFAVPAVAQKQAVVGERADHTFSSPLLGGPGVRSLAELRGAPVVIELWGTR